jgi:hypothetical protein
MLTKDASGTTIMAAPTEHHENVLVGTARIPDLLKVHGVDARVGQSFGSETLPEGLHIVVGRRPGSTLDRGSWLVVERYPPPLWMMTSPPGVRARRRW